MALFDSLKGGIPAVKEFLKKIDATILSWINTALDFTGKLIALETNPTVDMIAAAIQQFTGLPVLDYATKALTEIKGVEITAQNLATELATWLAGETPLGTHAKLVKLASVITNHGSVAAGAEQHNESFYDTAVQIHAVEPIVSAPDHAEVDAA